MSRFKKSGYVWTMPKLIKGFLSALTNQFSIQILKLRATIKNKTEYFVRIARTSSAM